MSTDELPILQRETILPSSDRGRLAAIVATCSLAGLAGGMALSMLAETHRAAEDARAQAAADAGPVTWLGVQLTIERGRDHHDACAGATVSIITAQSPAERIGLHRRDVIIGFGGDRVCDNDGLQDAVRASAIGSTPELRIKRGAQELVFHPKLATMPDQIRRRVFP